MLELQAIMYVVDMLSLRAAELRADPDRGDVAEKIVIVGIFVALAVAVGLIVRHAVLADATNISKTIVGAP